MPSRAETGAGRGTSGTRTRWRRDALLALGNTVEAQRLLRRACVVHATPEVRALSMIVTTAGP